MCSPIERIVFFATDVTVDESTRVEVTYAGLNEVSIADFETRREAVAYAERIGARYGVEVTELEPAE